MVQGQHCRCRRSDLHVVDGRQRGEMSYVVTNNVTGDQGNRRSRNGGGGGSLPGNSYEAVEENINIYLGTISTHSTHFILA